MIRENKRIIIICALVMLIPVIAGLLLWSKLPDQLITHWNMAGEADGYSSKTFVIFGLNGILYAMFGICLFATQADPKNKNISKKSFMLCVGIVPIISVFANAVTLGAGLGKEINVMLFMKLLISIIFIVIGNFIPKMRQSYTIGIKLPWTLNSEENWNKTHRFAGRIWVICGLVLLTDAFAGFLPIAGIIAIFVIMIFVPFVYSYLYYLKEKK